VSGGVRVDVAVSDLPGPVPLEIEISGASGTRVERVTLDPTGGSWTFPGAARAEVNPNRELLATVKG